MTKLSAAAARELSPGGILRDHEVKGLQLKARASSKSWHFYYRSPVDGAERRPKIGDFPALTLEAARSIAREYAQRVARGEDPSAERTALRGAPTMADLVREFQADGAYRARKPRTIAEDDRHCRLVVKHMGGLRVADVTVDDCNRVLRLVTEGRHRPDEAGRPQPAPVAANRLGVALSAILSYAERARLGWRPRHSNPMADDDVLRNRERLRRVHATAADLAKLADELDRLEGEWPRRVAAIRCILLCGSRVTELITAPRSALDGNRAILSEHKTDRTGDDRTIVFPRQALEIVNALPDDGSGLIFGLDYDGKPLDRFRIFHVFEMARERAGCPQITVRDLRRTFASAAKTAGKSLDAIGEVFGHKDPSTTRRYAWLFDDGADDLVQETADTLAGFMGK